METETTSQTENTETKATETPKKGGYVEMPKVDYTNVTQQLSTVEELEAKKKEMIDRIVEIKKRVHYKEIQKKTIIEALRTEGGPDARDLRKQLRALEFRISTQAHTPNQERKFLKEIQSIEKEYEAAAKLEKKRKKVKLIEQDIDDFNTEILKIDLELKTMRKKISVLGQRREKEAVAQAGVQRKRRNPEYVEMVESFDTEVTLGDLAIFEDLNKKKKKK